MNEPTSSSALAHCAREREAADAPDSRPPAIIVGGLENAVSVARSLGARGTEVFALNQSHALVRHSRYCRWLREAGEGKESWAEFLLGPQSESLRGAFVLACSDEGLDMLIEHREALLERYALDLCDPEAQATVLNKLSTVEAAARAGVPAPRHWVVKSIADVERIQGELSYPLVVKPLLAHVFAARFQGRKYLRAESHDEVRETLAAMEEARVPFMLQEMIPGLDDRLCSYYTYLDEELKPQFDFTKRLLRRYPVNEGGGSYHITTRDPEVKELALRFLQCVGLQGLSVVEFKRDDRDGQLKLIECNGRLSAANNVLVEAGLDLPIYVYNRALGIPQGPLPKTYRDGLHLWNPVLDLKAFCQLRRMGKLTFWGWIKSISHRKITPYWSWRDPLPSVVACGRLGRGLVRRVLAWPFRRRRSG